MTTKRPSRSPVPPPSPLESVWPPRTSEVGLTMSMLPLFDRGVDALAAFIDTLPPGAQPLGWKQFRLSVVNHMKVVTAADFDANASLIRKHVCASTSMVHVLCEDGHLCALVEPRVIRHW